MANAVGFRALKDLTALHRLGLKPGVYRVANTNNALKIRWFGAEEVGASEVDGRWIVVDLSLATGVNFRLCLQEGLFHTLLEAIEPAQFWQLDSLMRCACLQVCNRDILEWFKRCWQCAIRVDGVSLPGELPEHGQGVAFTLIAADALNYQTGLLVLADAGQRYPLAALCEVDATRKKISGARVPLCLDIIAGKVRIPVAGLQGLQANDVILLEADEFSTSTAWLCLQDRSLFSVDIEQSSVRVKQILRFNLMADTDIPTADPTVDGSQDNNNPVAKGDGNPTQRIDCEALDVVLHFSLGTLTRTLAEIEDIAEGDLLEMPRLSADCVDIRVNGKRIARGEPVRIEDQIGVRIVKIESG